MTSPAARSTRTQDLVARDLRSLWHPFTQHAVWPADEPLVVDRAEGMYLWDTDGNRYLDGVSSLWVTVHGHRVPEIDAAVRAQLDRLDHATFLGLTHEPGIELAERLLATRARRADPGLLRRRRLVGGRGRDQDGLPGAGPARRRRPARPLYLHVAEGYHGDTLGAVSVGGIELFHATYRPILLDTRMVSSPGLLAPGQDRAGARRRGARRDARRSRGGRRARSAPWSSSRWCRRPAGCSPTTSSFLRGVRALCDEFGALMVVDEVATGIGRTGRMWAVDHAGVTPDLLTCGKGLTGGYLPLSAVLAREEVYEAFLGAPGARPAPSSTATPTRPTRCAARRRSRTST